VQRNPPTVNFGFLNRSCYFSIQAAPQLSSRGWVDPVPDSVLLRKSSSAGNRTRDLWICSQISRNSVPLPLNSETLLYPWQQLAIPRIKPLLRNVKYTTDRYRGNAPANELLRCHSNDYVNELFASLYRGQIS
jgi:hypothetical protein